MSNIVGESVLVDRFPYDGAPIVWPVTIQEAKRHTQVAHSADDALIEFGTGGYLAAATEEIESRGQVSLVYQKRKLILDRMPVDESVYVIRGPLVSITDVKYLDASGVEQTLAPTNYRARASGRGSVIYFRSNTGAIATDDGPGVVWANMICGFGSEPDRVPAQWRQLVFELAAYKYERRDGVAGGGIDEAFERIIDRKVVVAGGVRRYA